MQVEDEYTGRLEETFVEGHYRVDLRTSAPDVFEDISETDWGSLTWDRVGRPYQVDNLSKRRRDWEKDRGRPMPVPVQWENFNRQFHELFISGDAEHAETRRRFVRSLGGFRFGDAGEAVRELAQARLWNYVHRAEDAVWDPRGKRALFDGLDLERPRILFLGAADGYEAMQLLAMYPGGEAVMVDYDDFCRTERFGNFPERYPFLGKDSAGRWSVSRRSDFDIEFVVDDIRNLKYGKEFDVVLSVGLIEHFPDEFKPEAFDFHRRFLRPGGYAIFTTPRKQLRSRLFYLIMGDIMNYGYRELMTARQLGLYAWEAGFDVLRAGHIKAHNGLVTRLR